jgi:hypothetical protein
MPQVEFSDRELLRGTIVEPAWYRVYVEGVGEGTPSKDGKSTNFGAEGTILFNGDTGATNFRNVPIDWNFNSKAMGFAVGFLKAFGVDLAPRTRYELNSAAGKEIDIYIDNRMFEGRTLNNVSHKYRAPKPEVKAVD